MTIAAEDTLSFACTKAVRARIAGVVDIEVTMVVGNEMKTGNVAGKAEIRSNTAIFLALGDEGKSLEVFHCKLLRHFTNLFRTIKKTKFVLFIEKSRPFK